MHSPKRTPIAIVGLGAILPDACSVDSFWENVLLGRYSIRETPPERWSIDDYYNPDPRAPGKTYSKIGGWVQGFTFDALRLRVPPRVADAMDVGQQWAVTVAEQALRDYGYPQRPLDTERMAVIFGTAMGGEQHYLTHDGLMFPEYARALQAVPEFQQIPPSARQVILEQWKQGVLQAFPPVTEDSMPGELANIYSGRVANLFNLRGPNFIADAACASSFAAIDAALGLLERGEVDAVISGGVDRNMGVSTFIKFCKIGALSATGTRPFGLGADGFVMGEGAAGFLLKRLDDAERAGDPIYAVLLGVGGSSDGKGKGIYAPNPLGQQLAMRRAWESACLPPETATLIEAHGTSTRVGDVVEAESMAVVFGKASPGSIALGSVKSNIGHLKAGAGAAGLLKAALALHHKILPPTLNARTPNPDLHLDQTALRLNHEAADWPAPADFPRRAGVSANGFGGTNFHLVLEEYVPGRLADRKPQYQAVTLPEKPAASGPAALPPLRGILALGAASAEALQGQAAAALVKAQSGWNPARELPDAGALASAERLVIDHDAPAELAEKLTKALKAFSLGTPEAWKALQPQGIFRGSGAPLGKIAFLFPGQGSQYANMGRELGKVSPLVAGQFAEADRVMTSILGRPLSEYIFVDTHDPQQVAQAEWALMQTAITQPAMLTLDLAIYRLMEAFGFKPDLVMGHSLGEYAALIAAEILPFEDALEATAARGHEMSALELEDNGWMAAVMAPQQVIQEVLAGIDGYVVAANLNSPSQAVIGGASQAVEQALGAFQNLGYEARRIPVSHAFHTRLVAPASAPLRQVLNRLRFAPPRLPLVGNVTGDLYPTDVEAIKDLLERQVASPVQWLKGLQTLYEHGVRTFVEIGPKKALKGFVDDLFAGQAGVISLFSNHPKTGELASFNHALCGLLAAGYAPDTTGGQKTEKPQSETMSVRIGEDTSPAPMRQAPGMNKAALELGANKGSNGGQLNTAGERQERMQAPINLENLANVLAQRLQQPGGQVYLRSAPPAGSVVISGTGLGLPGTEKAVMDPENAWRILHGEQFVDLIPERFRKRIMNKQVTRLVKSEDGGGRFEVIDKPADVVKLAGRGGYFDLSEEYGVSPKLIEALDRTSQLAIAAGLDALREAGIPLVQTYRATSTGKVLPDRWLLPEGLRDETGVIFASAFPGGDRFADEFERYHTWENRRSQVQMLDELLRVTREPAMQQELIRRIGELRARLDREPYEFDRRFLFRILAMGHSQMAEYIGARGPNTHVNAACASTTQALGIAEDWIRGGRCRRVLVVGADDVTSDHLMEWVGAGFLATGAVATDDTVDEAVLPFDRRRHGTVVGMGACALLVESEDAVSERGMRAIVELLNSETLNSAFHGTRLDVEHIAGVMDRLVTTAEERFGLHRQSMAPQTVFMSHETFTPARGGSASAEVMALRKAFGAAAGQIIVANTKGFTGHPMGVGIEDVIAVKILETGIVPPVPNLREEDPELGPLNLSRGGVYPVQYALHLAAGFGSQIAMTFLRRIPGAPERIDRPQQYRRWLEEVSGQNRAETEVVKRVLRIVATGRPERQPAASQWEMGSGPRVRAASAPPALVETGMQTAISTAQPDRPVVTTQQQDQAPAPQPAQVSIPATPAPPREQPAPAIQKPDQLQAAQPAAPQPAAPSATKPVEEKPAQLAPTAPPTVAGSSQPEQPAEVKSSLQENPPTIGEGRNGHENQSLAGSAGDGQPPAAGDAQPVEPGVPAHSSGSVAGRVLEIVAAKTGYPVDLLEPDLDLEADLGIDTVKQAETFLALREAFDIPRQENLRLRDYPTLGHVIGFVESMRPKLAGPSGVTGPSSPAAPEEPATPEVVAAPEEQAETDAHTTDQDQVGAGLSQPPARQDEEPDVVQGVLEIVAAKTGYPVDLLELDLDLEADLGIDTVKQAETFLALREAFDIPRQENLRLRDYPTLGHVVNFVRSMRSQRETHPVSHGAAKADEDDAEASLPACQIYDLSAADRLSRRVPVPVWLPDLDNFAETGVQLIPGSRVIVAAGEDHDPAQALTAELQALGVEVLSLEAGASLPHSVEQARAWAAEGLLSGVYWLPALAGPADVAMLTPEQWQAANYQQVHRLFAILQVLDAGLAAAGGFVVAATRLDGMHGYTSNGAAHPLGGAVAGLCKSYHQERPELLVKVVDFDQAALPGGSTGQGQQAAEGAASAPGIAEVLIAETLRDRGNVEVGRALGQRWTVGLTERSLDASLPASLKLDHETVFVVTGAAGGITSEIVADLAQASGGIFYLLDLAALPDPASEEIRLLRTDREALKARLIGAIQARGERPTPAQVERQLAALERQEAALRAVQAVESAGGRARGRVQYRQLDLRDGQAVAAVIEEIRAAHGRIDVLVHAAGIEISKPLLDKPLEQFDLVYGVKADGFYNLLRASRDLPVGVCMVFSSIAGRFGNRGQADYSAANDLLCKLVSSLRHLRPETRAVAIDWTAWRGIGMAARGSIPTIMAMAGIDMLEPEIGVPTVRREILAGQGEVLVAGSLGVLVDENQAGCALDAARLNRALRNQPQQWPMIGRITGWRGACLLAETDLDPLVQPFLHDHALSGTALLPGVMVIETLAELGSLLSPGANVAEVRSIEFNAPFKFYRNERQTLYLEMDVSLDERDGRGDLLANGAVRSRRRLAVGAVQAGNGDGELLEREHFQAQVRLSREKLPAPQPLPAPQAVRETIASDRIYRVFFHGPAYQVLERVDLNEPGENGWLASGWMQRDLPPEIHPAGACLIAAPRWVELCLQTAGVWQASMQGVLALPRSIECVRFFAQPAEGQRYMTRVRLAQAPQGGADPSFDMDVLDESGRLYLQVTGYHTTPVESEIKL